MNPTDDALKVFRVHGMDCAEEVAILERELAPLVGGAQNLTFDVVNKRMGVLSGRPSEAELRAAVAATGMHLAPWSEEETEGGFWRERGRTVLCWASGVLLLLGFITHGLHAGGFANALAGSAGHALPSWVIGFYAVAVVSGAWFVAPKAAFALKRRRPDMNLLMMIAVLGAITIGEWFEAGAVSFLFALALLLESWSVGRARRAIQALVEVAPSTARVRQTDSEVEEVAVDAVLVGSVIVVPPGERIPLDGRVETGSTSVDESSITGESVPVPKSVGSEVFAGTINGEGAIEFRSTRGASDTQMARIIQMVEQAQSRRAPSEQWVERFARYYTPAMLLVAMLLAFVPPLVDGEWAVWFYQALVILVIACPCALVIATPVSIVAGLATAARNGVLIKGGVHLEAPARLRAIAMDKTGTLTFGRPRVERVIPLADHSERDLLGIAAALEADSTHPLASAILEEARSLDVDFKGASNLRMLPGRGAEADIDGKRFWIGSHRLMEERGIETPEAHKMAMAMEGWSHSVVVMGNDHHVCGLISITDAVRPDSKSAIRALRELGVERIIMLTGDNRRTAEAVASATGVDQAMSELLPEDKVAAVVELTGQFGFVAMVGDGVNDAPALAASSTGIAMGAIGSAAAVETADIALMSDEIGRLPWLVSHSRRTLAVIKQNIVFALGLKLAFIVLAVSGLATLWMAIAADMGASLLVIGNGLRLLRGGGGS